MENKIESLASKCRKIIAINIERYPPEYFGSLPEMEWEEIVRTKYTMTAPKIQVQKVKGSNLLSDGRKFPVFTAKLIQDIEDKNPHLKHSEIIDQLVWKDCVDFKFKQGGPSRPLLFREPWNLQVDRLKSIVEQIQNLSMERNEDGDGSPTTPTYKRNVVRIVKDLKQTAITVPLLSASGIGKGIKKLIKKLRATNTANELISQLEVLLQDWKDLASAKGVVISKKNNKEVRETPSSTLSSQTSIDGKNRHTSDEQHAEDLQSIEKCVQWRNLFEALSTREKKLFKSHGEKMRKIRQTLEVGRPKISTAKTKNNKLLRSTGGLQLANESNPVRKLGKLRQEFNHHNAIIKGGKARINQAKTVQLQKASFGSSVSNAMSASRKRPLATTPNSNKKQQMGTNSSRKRTREVVLNDGKKMKLPKKNIPHMNFNQRFR